MNKPIRWKNGVLAVLTVLALALAWANRFVQDDAFISFRYARNLAQGHGLVWNIGERVEGYTNFLWTVCLAPAWLGGLDPVLFAYGLSLAAMGVTLLLSHRLTLALGARWEAGLLCVFLLATNYSFSCYGTGGLETQFVTAWVLAVAWLLMRPHGNMRGVWTMVAAGVASACAVMTRMDAVILLCPFWVWQVVEAWRQRAWRQWLALFVGGGAAALPVVLWLAWRHSYYGAWVPNTFFIKSVGVSWIRGAYYVGLFYLVYGFWLVAPACMRGLRRLGLTPTAVCIGTSWLLWNVYVVSIGGDFMEFRMMMPSLPLLMVLVSGGVSQEAMARWKKCALVTGLIVLSFLHGFRQYPYPCIQTIRDLRTYHAEWMKVAETLNAALGEKKGDVKIAVTCAGIIPFYTGQPVLDLLGLNDRLIVNTGESIRPANKWIGNRPGHVKMADWQTVIDRNVNLLINTPWVVEIAESELLRWKVDDIVRYWYWHKTFDPKIVTAAMVRYPFAPDAKSHLPDVIAWPMGQGRYLISVYMKKSPVVDEAILRTGACVLHGASAE